MAPAMLPARTACCGRAGRKPPCCRWTRTRCRWSTTARAKRNSAARCSAPGAVVAAVVAPQPAATWPGLYAGGTIVRGNRNSKGQRHWFSTHTFFLDYSLYDGPQAAKGSYAGSHWDDRRLGHQPGPYAQPAGAARPAGAGSGPRPLSQPTWRRAPSPNWSAMMGWNALSVRRWSRAAARSRSWPERELASPRCCSCRKTFALGLAPRFNCLGEVSAPALALIEEGELRNLLVSSRTAKEYGLPATPPTKAKARVRWTSAPARCTRRTSCSNSTAACPANLHYLNWSDPVSARVTGMTRYACFWVEGGEIAGRSATCAGTRACTTPWEPS